MQRCENSCPKIRQKAGSSQGAKSQTDEEPGDPNSSLKSAKRSVTSGRRSPLQSQKSVQIGGVTAVEVTDSRVTRSSERSGKYSDNKSVPGSGSRESSQRSEQSKQSRMSARVRSSPRGADQDWNSAGHNPCPSVCPMSKARDLAARKAQLRQERLDEYLLTKGFSYFDDLCTCSSICLINQLRRDKFVLDFLKSACIFTLGVKLCEELDAWNIIG